jgi:hypothetical protein
LAAILAGYICHNDLASLRFGPTGYGQYALGSLAKRDRTILYAGDLPTVFIGIADRQYSAFTGVAVYDYDFVTPVRPGKGRNAFAKRGGNVSWIGFSRLWW